MKLADASVVSMLKDYVKGVSHKELAAKYKVSEKTVPDFVSGKSRAWLLGRHGCPSAEDLRAAKRRAPGAKLTQNDVAAIKERIKSGHTGKEIARDFGIHKATVSDIKTGKIWKDV